MLSVQISFVSSKTRRRQAIQEIIAKRAEHKKQTLAGETVAHATRSLVDKERHGVVLAELKYLFKSTTFVTRAKIVPT